jgi:erythromycin esterase-like protein
MAMTKPLLAAAAALLLVAGGAGAQAPKLTRLPSLDGPKSLDAVRRAIGDARVVVLGEPVYGDGGALEAKLQLVRMLHRDLGFDVLAFESGALDMDRVDRALAQPEVTLASAASQGLLSFWARSAEVDSLLAYVRASRATARPITLAGFDIQATAADPGRWAKDVITAIATAWCRSTTTYPAVRPARRRSCTAPPWPWGCCPSR